MLVDSFEISGELSFINNVNAKVIVKIVQSMVRIPEMRNELIETRRRYIRWHVVKVDYY